MRGTASYDPQGSWHPLPGVATDIGAGGGAVWMIGRGAGNSDPGIYRWDERNQAWVQEPTGLAGTAGRGPEDRPQLGPRSSLAADEHGRPWITDERQRIFRLNGISWELLPGAAKDLDFGGDTAWAVGTGPQDAGGASLYQWDETQRLWRRDPVAYGARVCVDDFGVPWHVDERDGIYRGVVQSIKRLPGNGKDLGAGGGEVWVIGTEAGEGGFRVCRWDDDRLAWIPDGHGFATRITVDSHGCPWMINSAGKIFRKR